MKRAIQSDGRVILYEILNDAPDSRKKRLGYELAILTEKGKLDKSWSYESSEDHWARHGYKTLVDAETKGVLARRDQWEPYGGRDTDSCCDISPTIESKALIAQSSGTLPIFVSNGKLNGLEVSAA